MVLETPPEVDLSTDGAGGAEGGPSFCTTPLVGGPGAASYALCMSLVDRANLTAKKTKSLRQARSSRQNTTQRAVRSPHKQVCIRLRSLSSHTLSIVLPLSRQRQMVTEDATVLAMWRHAYTRLTNPEADDCAHNAQADPSRLAAHPNERSFW